jgi:hypothetical protein
MVRLAQQQLSSSAARANSWMPLTHLLSSIYQLLCCWHELLQRVPVFMHAAARTLLSLVQQLQGCGSLLGRPAAAAAHSAPTASVQASSISSSSSSSWEHQLQCTLVLTQGAAAALLSVMDEQQQFGAGVPAEVLMLQNDPAVALMQLQLLTAWTAELHKQHTAQQQQQQLLPPGTAGASSSMQQHQQESAKQKHRADLLSIPAFHQDMLQLLPGGKAYLDAAAAEAAGWGLTAEGNAVRLRIYAGCCCHTINQYLCRHMQSIAGQQLISSNAQVVSGAAVRLLLELQLLACGAVQRQREQHRQRQRQQPQQQQRQQTLPPEDQAVTDNFALQSWELLGLQIKALVATSRSCLPPEVLQQAGLQLLQALAAPLQQWQLSRRRDSFFRNETANDALLPFGDTLLVLVTAACGAQRTYDETPGGQMVCGSVVFACQSLDSCAYATNLTIRPPSCKRRPMLLA